MPIKKAHVKQVKSGSYQVSYSLGYNYVKRRYETFTRACPAAAEAYALAARIEEYIYYGGSADKIKTKFARSAPVTFRDYAARWIKKREGQGRDGKRGKRLEKRTISENVLHVNRMSAIIGEIPLEKLNSEVIAHMFFALEIGDDRHRPCGGTYRQHIYTTLDLILKDAEKDDIVRGPNPLLGVERPSRDTKEKTSLTAEEARSCIKAIGALPRLNAKAFGVLLCLTCGLRPSEMLALTWGDVHLEGESPYIHVWRSAEKDKQRRKGTKTNRARDVPILIDTVPSFNAWAEEQRRLFSKLGLGIDGDTPVVSNKTGQMVIESYFRKWLRKNAKALCLPEWATPYSLRHSFVTLSCVGCNINLKTIGSIVGHAYVSTTETYIHRLDREVCEAAQVISSFLFAGAESGCRDCAHWSPSPHPSIGACWAKGAKGITATLPDDSCPMLEPKHGNCKDERKC